MPFAVVDFQTKFGGKDSNSLARVYIPVGYSVKPGVVDSALRQSVATGRGVAILPPVTKVYGRKTQKTEKTEKTTQCKPFSEVSLRAELAGHAPHELCSTSRPACCAVACAAGRV